MDKDTKNIFLFSVDVEDDRIPGEEDKFSGRVPGNVETYLTFLKEHKMVGSFFVLGNIAREYPELLRKIEDQGHEIGCHSDSHIPLDKLDEKSFKEDLEKNVAAIKDAGIAKVSGYRAPCLSMSEKTSWAYKVLAEMDFVYSSSVLPAANPHYGWAGFPKKPSQQEGGVWEIPVTLSGLSVLDIPFAAGSYFRVFPFFLTKYLFKRCFRKDIPVIAYFHPYDIDPDQRKNAFPDVAGKPFFNWMLYANRRTVMKKLEVILDQGASIGRYDEFVAHCV
jgi:polysaccharide deacetylase family protein (PEP-CTERM system associated)